jgi:hypothetical protein
MTATASVYAQASIVIHPIALERAVWQRQRGLAGLGLKPIKGTWYALTEKRGFNSSVIVPIISCPSCAGLLFISNKPEAAQVIGRMVGHIVPVAHAVDLKGKIAPDIRCMHDGCSFHRTVYLDKWDRLRPLYCTAYTRDSSIDIEFAFSHAASAKEARFHLGAGNFNIIGVGRAVGFLFDEKARKFDVA